MVNPDVRPVRRLLAGLEELEQALVDWEKGHIDVRVQGTERMRRLAVRLQAFADGFSRTAERGGDQPPAEPDHGLVGNSPCFKEVMSTVARVGSRGTNVLIEGESGTGKELVALAVHRAWSGSSARFVAVDCGSVSDGLLESELFGHRRGAFTGASADRVGLLEEADGGTLFLDELANASSSFQARLLRVLQEGEIRRVGENRSRQVRLRVIAATSGDLPALVRAGRFREDLYYRLNVVTLNLPPLRRRIEDIPLLAGHFLALFALRHGLPARSLSPAAQEILLRYRWPGNVRELKNVVERALLMCTSEVVKPDHLPPPLLDSLLHFDADSQGVGKTGEQRMIERALLESNGDKTRAARLIGWHRTKLYRRLKRYGIANSFGKRCNLGGEGAC